MDLKNKLLENTEDLIGITKPIPDPQFNMKAEEDTWSVADVFEHLYRSEYGIPRLLTGKTTKEIDRAVDANLELMREQFLKSDTKMKASGVILPTEGEKSKEDLIFKFHENRKKIAELSQELDPGELCLAFKHPVYGFLTRLEWVHFNIIHTRRHIKQIKRILSQLN
ncbi:MAG TPA: DinB family protein [Gracilimonas sp.]|uniref:DinB family protein n=1 Tax=Gracilimonas sp. TaxID=1974203 RepID=UPI002D899F69|nr:DinB family protein [Gracilimonas sp.]